MKKDFLERDPFTGISTFHSYDHTTQTTSIHYEGDAEPILEANKTAAGMDHGRFGDGLHHAASIPAGVIMLWRDKYGIDIYDNNHRDGVKRLLNSSEWAHLRVQHFRI